MLFSDIIILYTILQLYLKNKNLVFLLPLIVAVINFYILVTMLEMIMTAMVINGV